MLKFAQALIVLLCLKMAVVNNLFVDEGHLLIYDIYKKNICRYVIMWRWLHFIKYL
jgi:hypothetical protein